LLKAVGHEAEASIVQGRPETAVSHAVESNAIDPLVMGAYGHSRVRSLIIGSTTTGMIRSCKVPIALFR
jgi:nucleotide-binding universal stress UspA family protein